MTSQTDPFLRVLSQFDAAAAQTVMGAHDDEEEATIESLCDSLARFGKRRIDSQRVEQEKRVEPAILKELAEMGLFGLSIEPQFGGAGLSFKGTCRLMELLSQMDMSLGVTVGLHVGLGLRALNYYGSADLKDRYLPRLARGELIACYSMTETEAGSDIPSIRTTVKKEGDQLVLNGSKIFVTNGNLAHVATVGARGPGEDGLTMVLVPLDTKGVERGPEENKMGLRGSSTCSLYFDDVRIDEDHMIGVPSQGLSQMYHALTWGRTLMAGGCIGLSRDAFSRTLRHVTTRRQFKRPLSSFGMVQQRLAAMRTRIHTMESLIRLVAWLEDSRPTTAEWESTVAKIFCTQGVGLVADHAMQLHGGSGFVEDTGIARIYRDCRVTRIFEGANDLLRRLVATSFLRGAMAGQLRYRPSVQKMMDPVFHAQAEMFDALLQGIDEDVTRIGSTQGWRVLKKQMYQQRVADSVSALYCMLAVLARAEGALRCGQMTDDIMRITTHACHVLGKTCERNMAELDDNVDHIVREVAVSSCAQLE